MPRGFAFPRQDVDIWTPIAFTPRELANFGAHYLVVVAELRPGVTVKQANATLMVLTRRMAKEDPDD